MDECLFWTGVYLLVDPGARPGPPDRGRPQCVALGVERYASRRSRALLDVDDAA
jgi:hypothetical protein